MNQTNSDSLQGELAHLRRGVDLQVCYHPGTSPRLVFLHGGLGNRLNWRSQYKFFCTREESIFVMWRSPTFSVQMGIDYTLFSILTYNCVLLFLNVNSTLKYAKYFKTFFYANYSQPQF